MYEEAIKIDPKCASAFCNKGLINLYYENRKFALVLIEI